MEGPVPQLRMLRQHLPLKSLTSKGIFPRDHKGTPVVSGDEAEPGTPVPVKTSVEPAMALAAWKERIARSAVALERLSVSTQT